jgi:phage/plasmid primase-like uncharacterized protein
MSLTTHAVIRHGHQLTRDCPVCGKEMHKMDDENGRLTGWQCQNDDCAHREEP